MKKIAFFVGAGVFSAVLFSACNLPGGNSSSAAPSNQTSETAVSSPSPKTDVLGADDKAEDQKLDQDLKDFEKDAQADPIKTIETEENASPAPVKY